MKKLCIFLVLFTASAGHAQNGFLYAGYRVGKYTFHESPYEVYAGKFNLGWAFSKTNDKAMVFFDPTADKYEITKPMEWGNFQQGISLGGVFPVDNDMSVEIGFHQYNQKASGERVNLTTNVTEKFSLQSKSGGLTFNVVYSKNEWIQPFIGIDMGRYKMRYWFESDSIDVNHQRMGYIVRLIRPWGVGSHPIYVGLNLGAYIKVFNLGKASLKLVPQFQGRVNKLEEINGGILYADKKFRHNNYSLSFLFTYDLK